MWIQDDEGNFDTVKSVDVISVEQTSDGLRFRICINSKSFHEIFNTEKEAREEANRIAKKGGGVPKFQDAKRPGFNGDASEKVEKIWGHPKSRF